VYVCTARETRESFISIFCESRTTRDGVLYSYNFYNFCKRKVRMERGYVSYGSGAEGQRASEIFFYMFLIALTGESYTSCTFS